MNNLKEKLGKTYYIIMDCVGIGIGFLLSYLGRICAVSRVLSMILMLVGIVVICFFGVLLVRLGKKNEQNVEGESEDEVSEDAEETDSENDKDAEIERLKAELNNAHARLSEYESSDEGDISEEESFVEDDPVDEESEEEG